MCVDELEPKSNEQFLPPVPGSSSKENIAVSSVARGGGAWGAIAPPIGLPTKMQNKKKIKVFGTFKTVFWTGLD